MNFVWTDRLGLTLRLPHVTDKVLDLRRDCEFNMRVTKAHWNEEQHHWDVTAGSPGQERRVSAKHIVFCLGFASKVNWPTVEGLDQFKGEIHHSGNWPARVEAAHLSGKKVAVVGSGASGVQIAQEIGPHVKEMSVYIRTPNLCLPMKNYRTSPESQEIFKDIYADIFKKRWQTFGGFHYDFDYLPWDRHSPQEREMFYEELWKRGGFHFWLETYIDVYYSKDCNRTAYDFWQKKTASRIKDQKKRDILVPKEWPHTFGTVRPSLETRYYEVLDQDNVEVVDAKTDPIARFTEGGVQQKSGKETTFDFIALATGFDSHTGGFKQIDIRGQNGMPLTEKWQNGCNSYLGLTTSGFPNLFFLYGPHGPTAYSNGPSTVEVQTEWVTKCIDHLLKNGIDSIEPEVEAEADFTKHIDELSAATLFHESLGWYMGRNVPGKPVQALNFTGGTPLYAKELAESAEAGYKGFKLKGRR